MLLQVSREGAVEVGRHRGTEGFYPGEELRCAGKAFEQAEGEHVGLFGVAYFRGEAQGVLTGNFFRGEEVCGQYSRFAHPGVVPEALRQLKRVKGF